MQPIVDAETMILVGKIVLPIVFALILMKLIFPQLD